MKKYSKGKLKIKRGLKVLIFILLIILVISSIFIATVGLNNNIVYEKIDENAKIVSEDEAINSTPVIIDNLVIGGIYDKKWVSSEKYYLKSKNKDSVEIDIYNNKGKAGKFVLNSMEKSSTANSIYAKTTNTNTVDEYLAITTGSDDIMPVTAAKVLNVGEEDIAVVKKGLGFRRIFNTTVKINSVYEAKLEDGGYSKVYFVTNQAGKSSGAYSAVIYKGPSGKISCIKYNYVKDIKNASNWPVYSFKFVADLNRDGNNELIIQETKEFEVKYDVLEYRKNKFYEVLSAIIKLS